MTLLLLLTGSGSVVSTPLDAGDHNMGWVPGKVRAYIVDGRSRVSTIDYSDKISVIDGRARLKVIKRKDRPE